MRAFFLGLVAITLAACNSDRRLQPHPEGPFLQEVLAASTQLGETTMVLGLGEDINGQDFDVLDAFRSCRLDGFAERQTAHSVLYHAPNGRAGRTDECTLKVGLNGEVEGVIRISIPLVE